MRTALILLLGAGVLLLAQGDRVQEKEAALGRAMAAQVERQYPVISAPPVAEYLSKLGDKIAGSVGPGVHVTAKVIESGEIPLVVLPGGYVFISTGTVLRTESEAELAGLFAHAIAHLVIGPLTIRRVLDMSELVARGPAGMCMRFSEPKYSGAQILIPRSWLPNIPVIEEQADQLAIEYLSATGYDPEALIDGFRRIPAVTVPPTLPTGFTAPKEAIVTTSKYDEMKAKVAAITAQNTPRRAQPTLYRY